MKKTYKYDELVFQATYYKPIHKHIDLDKGHGRATMLSTLGLYSRAPAPL